MISSISQSGGASSIWQAYAARKAASSETSETSENKVEGTRPPPPQGPPPPKGGVGPTSTTDDSSSLTSDQEDLITSLLEEYDASALTEEDATSIIQAFSDAGINESSALSEAIKANGFDPQEIRNLVPISASFSNGGLAGNYMQTRETMGSLSIVDDTELSQTVKSNQQLLSFIQQYQNSQDSLDINTTNLMSMNILA
ncbi:MAG: hypothetical protein ACOH15_10395 [Acetobacterium sp.]